MWSVVACSETSRSHRLEEYPHNTHQAIGDFDLAEEAMHDGFTKAVDDRIENSMAEEIFRYLRSGFFNNGANLTNDDQLASSCEWILNLYVGTPVRSKKQLSLWVGTPVPTQSIVTLSENDLTARVRTS
ncbi:MAG: hypothetical protein C4326_14745 [Ignavibacteria bacterium]